MSNTMQRIIASAFMILGAVGIAVAEHWGYNAVRYAGIAIVAMMIFEYLSCLRRASADVLKAQWRPMALFMGLLIAMMVAVNVIGKNPDVILQLLLVICAADVGAWLFGHLIGGDKMWERLSAGKTWAGQIAGIICGAITLVAYGFITGQENAANLVWFGISIALLSQYGDITASWIKRKLGIKDFGTILPGHGGVLDRFDGWIYVITLGWLTQIF